MAPVAYRHFRIYQFKAKVVMAAERLGDVSPDAQPVTYSTRVDIWLAAALLLAFGAVIYEATVDGIPAAWGIGFLMALALRVMVLPCRYILMPDHLLVCSGVRRWEIPYEEIKSIMLSLNPASAPALSLRRVEIRYGRELMLVSPRSRTEFMAALYSRMKRSSLTRSD